MDKFKKFVPHFVAIVLFVGLSLVYFSPIVTEGKTLVQGDLNNMAGWGKDLKDYHEATGDYAYWSNSMFGGMPANYTYSPPTFNIFGYLGQILSLNLPLLHIGVLFLYLIGFYIFLISIGCKPWLSVVGALAYAFTAYNLIIIAVGHVNKGLVMATMAPILGGIILCYRGKYLWGSIVTLIFTGINVVWGHQQISYYLLLMILILATVYLVSAFREKKLKDYFISSGILLVIACLALAPALGNLISTADYSKETMRGGSVLKGDGTMGNAKESTGLDLGYAFSWSYGKGETMSLLIPNFYGGSSHYDVGEDSEFYKFLRKKGYPAAQAAQVSKYAPTYWGDQPFTDGNHYAGAIVCFLFVLGLFVVKGPEKWWLLIATLLSIVLAWGRHFAVVNDFLFYHLPLYNKFRTPTMALTVAEVTMAALAVLALKKIFDDKGNRRKYLKPIYISAGITGGLCLLFALLGGSLMGFSGAGDANFPPDLLEALVADRKHLLRADSLRSLVFIVLAMAALWYYLVKGERALKTNYLIAILGFLILIDLWTVDKRFLNNDSFVTEKKSKDPVPTEADKLILQDKDPNYRVLNLTVSTFNESNTAYFHKSIGGYSPAKLRRYQDIIDHYFADGINMNILNMLNTRYVIAPGQQNQPQVQRNSGALGNAWFVDELKWAATPDEEITALKDFDPATTAYVHEEWKPALPGWEALSHERDSTASIRLTNYANPGNLFYESDAAMPHFAVFSEVHYKTWHAYIDGEEAPVVRVNYILRGLQIPAGHHQIEFKCIDDVYLKSKNLSRTSSFIVLFVLLGLFGYAAWSALKRKEETLSPTNKN